MSAIFKVAHPFFVRFEVQNIACNVVVYKISVFSKRYAIEYIRVKIWYIATIFMMAKMILVHCNYKHFDESSTSLLYSKMSNRVLVKLKYHIMKWSCK